VYSSYLQKFGVVYLIQCLLEKFTGILNNSQYFKNIKSKFSNQIFLKTRKTRINVWHFKVPLLTAMLRFSVPGIKILSFLISLAYTYLLMWHYNQYLVKACPRRSFHDCLSGAQCVQSLTPRARLSLFIPSAHMGFDLP
jgi:hypothetical protein